MEKNLPRLAEKQHCCGCAVCYAICPKSAIELIDDEEGFFYPKIKIEKCIKCYKCSRVCPILERVKVSEV